MKNLGWKVDNQKLFDYLKFQQKCSKVYYFIGYIKDNEHIYENLRKSGFEIIFKETTKEYDNSIKGNIDAEMILQICIEIQKYEKAILLTSDGDFACVVRYLIKE